MLVKVTNLADDGKYIYSAHYYDSSPTYAVDASSLAVADASEFATSYYNETHETFGRVTMDNIKRYYFIHANALPRPTAQQ